MKLIRSWGMHNLVGHPMMQIFTWLGMPRMADAIHDRTLPPSEGGPR